MKVTYSPPPGDDRSVIYFGVEFFAGRPEDIDPAEHPLLAKKVVNNGLFVVSATDEADEQPDDIDALRAEAEGLGIDVDKRWGAARLRAEIDKKA